MAISVGSVEVDVIPNTRGILARLQSGLVPPATQVGDEIGRIIGRQLSLHIAPAVRDGINNGARAARPAAVRQGQQTGSVFARSLKAQLEAALRQLPEIRLHANSTDAQREIAQLRAQMVALSNARIGIDVDSATALAAIDHMQQRLARLSASDADVQVRVDAGAASAELAALQAQVARLDGQTARVDVDTSSATAGVHVLAASAITLGVAFLPVLPVIAAGLGAITSAAVSASVGVGALAAVAVPAFIQIGGALQAQKAAQDAASNAAYQGGRAAGQGASQALRAAGAQQSLAAAHRNAAAQIAAARDQVVQAQRGVERAERDLAGAQRDARQAQLDLTSARKEAAQELQDLNDQLAGAALSQRDAELSLQEAAARRDSVLKDKGASELDRKRAILAYDQAVQRLKEQTTETERLRDKTKTANKAGVEGSETYRRAQERLADAQQNVRDKTLGVADANRQVVKAQANVARVQAQAADSIASAQRQIAQSSLSAAGGVDQAAIAQAKYQAALAKLTPAARDTFDAFVSLRGAFSDWSRALQPEVMPIFTRALVGIKNSLPGLTPFVIAAADAIGDLQDRVSRGFDSPWWIQFRDELAKSVYPAIIGLGIGFGRIFKGMAGIVDAFLPHMDSISERMQKITGRFADWGTNLKGSPAFEQFLSYAAENGPLVARTIGDIASAFFQVAHSLSPISGPLLEVLGAVFRGIASIAETLPWLIQGLYLVYIATKLWTVALAIQALVLRANPLVLIITAIVALVAAVIYAYKHFKWFRNLVNAVWDALKTAALFVWNKVLKPVFNAIVIALKAVAKAAVWLWQNVLSPVFKFIWLAARILFAIVVTAVLLPIIVAFKLLAKVGIWLWNNALGPVVRGIGRLFTWLWNNIIKPVLGFIVAAFKLWWAGIKVIFGLLRTYILGPLGDVFKWLYDKVIKPVWDGIATTISVVWKRGIKPVFDLLKKGVGAVGNAFSVAVSAIGKVWGKIQEITRKPAQYVVDVVYNDGIRAVWNTVAKFVGLKSLDRVTFGGTSSKSTAVDYSGKPKVFASGGILPGYTPGRDVHQFYSPTGGRLALSGGEAIMRPEVTRALGVGGVNALNSAARTGGVSAVRDAMGFADGGVLHFASGGILGDVIGGLTGVAKKVGGAVMSGLDFVTNPGKLWDKATGFIKDRLKSIGESQWAQAIGKLPLMMLKGLRDKIVKSATGLFGGGGGPGAANGLAFAKSQQGRPYIWGGVGPKGYDCSGFMGAIQGAILGHSPFRRLWATASFAGGHTPAGWKRSLPAPFRVGITHAGVGHTAGTLMGVNVESRGGRGVVVGKGARGYNNSLFPAWYGYAPSIGGAATYDQGGVLPPGGLGYNGLSQPEAVLTMRQLAALEGAAKAGVVRGGDDPSVVYNIYPRSSVLDSQELKRITRQEETRLRVGRAR